MSSSEERGWRELAVKNEGDDEQVPCGRSSTCLAVIGERAYVFSGENEPRTPIDSRLHVFDLASGRWSALKHEHGPQARIGHSGVACAGKLYVYGGRTAFDHLETLSDLWCYDPATDAWQEVTPATDARPPGLSYHSMCSDGSDSVFLFGGCLSKGRCNQLWQYQLAANAWRLLPDAGTPPSARGGPGCCFVAGELHVAFGFNGKVELNDHHVYNVAAQHWRQLDTASPRPPPRSVTDIVALPGVGGAGSVCVFAGETTPSVDGHLGAGVFLDDTWIYDVAAQQWRQFRPRAADQSLPVGRGWFSSAATPDGRRMLVFAGLTTHRGRLNDLHIFDAGQ